MGKISSIWVLGFVVIFGIVRMSILRTIGETVQNAVADYHRVNARNVANSGVYVGLENIAEDNHWRGPIKSMSFSEGWCDLAVQDSSADSTLGANRLRLIGTGHSQDTAHTVQVVIEGKKQIPRLPGAIAVKSDSSTFNFSGSTFNIDGHDTNLDLTPGPGPDILGLSVSNGPDSARAVAQPKANRIIGITPAPSVGVDTDLPDLKVLANWLRRRRGTLLFSGGTYNDVNWGTWEDPAIVYIDGDGDIQGISTGYGILIINGDLKLAGTFVWYGLLIIFGDNLTIDTSRGTPLIMGGLLLQSETSATFDIRGNVDIIYSSEAIRNVELKGNVYFYRLVSWYE
jgi:hypothetical protein